MNRKKADSFLFALFEKHADIVIFTVLFLVSIYLRYRYVPLIDYRSGVSDYNYFLKPWVKFYRETGIVDGLREGVGNYYVPYNVFLALISKIDVKPYLPIALFSILFDYIIALFIYKIAFELKKSQKLLISDKNIKCFAILFALLPIVIENSSIWKQCDSIYSGFLLIALYYFLKGKYDPAFIFTGIAFAFKLQAVFIFPFLILFYIGKKDFSIVKFLWIPLIYLLSGLPAILCGRSVVDTYSIYFDQTSGTHMFENFPSIYAIGMESDEIFFQLSLFLPIVIFLFSLLFISQKKGAISSSDWLYIAAWCTMTCNEFLPGMHERYDFLAVILLTFVAIFLHNKILIPVIIIHLVSACTYGSSLSGSELNYTILACFYLGCYCWISYDLYNRMTGEKQTVEI